MAASTPKWPWITLIVLQALQLLSLLPWLMIAALSFMAFDAPGSEKMWQPWTFVIGIWSYPVWLLLAGIASWMLFAFRHFIAAVTVSAVFTMPVPVLVAVVLLANLSRYFF